MMRLLLLACALLCGHQSPTPTPGPAGWWLPHNGGLGELPLLCRRKTSGEGRVCAARMLRLEDPAPQGRRGESIEGQDMDSDGLQVGMPWRLRGGGVGIYDDVKGFGVPLDLPPRPEREPRPCLKG